VVEVDERVGRPQPLLNFFAGHQLTRPLERQGQHLKWLPAKFELQPVLAQLAGTKINFVNPEANDLGWSRCLLHGIPTPHGLVPIVAGLLRSLHLAPP
jgi:hypothetical protein